MRGIRGFAATLLLLTGFAGSALSLAERVLSYESGRAEYQALQEPLFPPEGAVQRDISDTDIENSARDRDAWNDLMISRNPDYAFWIWIPGTKISYPVVKNRVPSYYLNHTFSGKVNPCGSIFCQGEGDASEDNLILYGHNMKDGSMFADLKRYTDEEYCRNHQDIWIYRQAEWMHYRVYACRVINEKEESIYQSSFLNDEKKQAYFNDMNERALYTLEIRPSAADSIITLSTCFGKGKRVIVQAVLLCYTE